MDNNPKIGRSLDKLEPYYNKIVKNVSFNNENNNIKLYYITYEEIIEDRLEEIFSGQ